MTIPKEMRETARWILWRSVPDRKTGKPIKRPIDPHTKRPFKRGSGYLTDPQCWATYDEVVATGEPFGFVLGDGWAGLDFDDVIENGVIAPWVQAILRAFDTYAEISPSGTGLKVFMQGGIEGDPIARRASIELYDRQRFFTVTGRALSPAQCTITDCTEALQALYDLLRHGNVLDLCRLRGLLLASGKAGFRDLVCPWSSEHSTSDNHTSTSLHYSGTWPDVKVDGFSCLHSHCADRTLGDLRQWLGLRPFDTGEFPDVNTKTNRPIDNSQANIRLALKLLGVGMTHNEFANTVMLTWPEQHADALVAFEDKVRHRIWLTIDDRYKFRPSDELFDRVLQDEALRNAFHPVRDYLTNVQWDGVPRLDSWLTTYLGVPKSTYASAVGSLFLRAAVVRAFVPGAKFDEMLVLVDPKQGSLKSTIMRKLCPNEEWFTDNLPLGADAKEVIERTTGIWIAEVSDLHGYGNREMNQVKAFLSRQVDGPVRLAYGRLPVKVPRHFVVCGSTNSWSFLKDKTGNRRFWPVPVGSIDVAAFERDRDQLWAEAMTRRAEPIRLDPSLYDAAGRQQDAHRRDDPWMIALESAFTPNGVPMDRIRLVTPWDVLGITVDRRDDKATERLEEIMIALGYRKRVARGLHKADKDSLKRWCLDDPARAALAKTALQGSLLSTTPDATPF